MATRKIKISVLLSQGILYRIFIVLSQALFFYVYTGKIKVALEIASLWGVINIFLYYLFHYLFLRRFKIGK